MPDVLLADIAAYFQAYETLMSHWRALSPVAIFNLEYEKLVSNQESISRELIQFLGLEWDDACLDFHQKVRTSRTADAWQENQPVYSGSVERWRHYEPFIAELKNALTKSPS